MVMSCRATLKQFDAFDWLQKSIETPGISAALCQHHAFVSAVLHVQPLQINANAIFTRSQEKQADAHTTSADLDASKPPDFEQDMLHQIMAGCTHDVQCGDPSDASKH